MISAVQAMSWVASSYTEEEIEASLRAHLGDEVTGPSFEFREHFFLIRPGEGEVRIAQPLSEWVDAELRTSGMGFDISMSPHNMHPFDVWQRAGAGLAEFVVALGD